MVERVRNFFVKDITNKFINFQKEYIHLNKIVSFFNSDNRYNSELRTEIKNLTPVCNIIEERAITPCKNLLKELEKEGEYIKFYKNYIRLDYWIKWGIDMLSFLEKKIKYIMECFPKYYPIPNLSRTRQETGIYKAIKNDLNFYLKYFKKIFKLNINVEEDNVYIFWEYSGTNEFVRNILGLSNNNSFFLFKGAYYIIATPSLWTLLAHEVLHYYLRQFKCINNSITYKNRASSSDLNNIFNIFEEISIIYLESIYKIIENPTKRLMEVLGSILEDCFIDTVCLKILGTPYYFSCLRTLLGYDEFTDFITPIEVINKFKTDKIITPSLKAWSIRLLFLGYLIEENLSSDDNLICYNNKTTTIKDYLKFIKQIHQLRSCLTPFSGQLENIINIEKNIAKKLKICMNFVYNHITKTLIENDGIKQRINFYRDLYDRFIEETNENLHEGRILALTSRYNTFYSKNDEKTLILAGHEQNKCLPIKSKYIKKKVLIQNIFPLLRVLLIRFYKIRYDTDNSNNETKSIIKFLEAENDKSLPDQPKLMLHLGPYSYVDFDFNYTTKKVNNKDKYDEQFPYYTEETASTIVYYISKNDKLTSFFESTKNSKLNNEYTSIINNINSSPSVVIVQIKLASNNRRSTNNLDADKKMIEKCKLLIKEKKVYKYQPEVLVTIGFGWADYALIFFLSKGENSPNKYYRLYDFVKHIKKEIHQTNFILRSKTDILINVNKINHNEELPPLSIVLRETSLGSRGTELEKIKGEIEKTIDDKTKTSIFYSLGIYDLEIYINKPIKYQAFKNLLNYLSSSDLDLSFSDIQIRPRIEV